MADYVSICQVCGFLFHEEDYEEYPLKKGYCPFCNCNYIKKNELVLNFDELSSDERSAFFRALYKGLEENPYYDKELCYRRRLYEWSRDKYCIYFEDELIERSQKLGLWESWFKSKERKVLEEKYPENITTTEAPKPYYKSLERYKTGDEEEEIEVPKPKYIPRCPTCGSPDVVYGIMSRGWGPPVQYRCRNCGYEW